MEYGLPFQNWRRQIGGLLAASLCGREPSEAEMSSSVGDFLLDQDFQGALESVLHAGVMHFLLLKHLLK